MDQGEDPGIQHEHRFYTPGQPVRIIGSTPSEGVFGRPYMQGLHDKECILPTGINFASENQFYQYFIMTELDLKSSDYDGAEYNLHGLSGGFLKN